MRKVGTTLLIVVVLLGAVALLAPRFINVNRYHEQIQAELQKRLGRQVALGQMTLKLLPLSIRVGKAVIAEDKGFDTGHPFAKAEELAVGVKFWPLLRKEVEVRSVELVHPSIELVRNSQGAWNFSTLGRQTAAEPSSQSVAPSTPAAPAAPPPKTTGQLSMADLVVTDGQVAITDQMKHQARSVYDHIDLHLSNFTPEGRFRLKVAAHLPGQGEQTVHLEGEGGPIQQADLLYTPFDGAVQLEQVSLSALQRYANLQSLSGSDALISGRAKIKTGAAKLASIGTIRLDNAVIRGTKAGYPIALDYDATHDLASDVIQISKGALKLGATPITITGTIDSRPAPAQVNLKLTAKDASIAELARLASAFGIAFGKNVNVAGRLNMNLEARGSATDPQMNGQISAHNVLVSGQQLSQPVNIDAIDLTLTPDSIRSNDFTAKTGSTSVTGNVALAHYTTPNSAISAVLRAPGARIAELLNIAHAAGVSALEGVSGDGALTLDVHAQGPARNVSAMTFSGTGKVQNASLKLPSWTKPVQLRNADVTLNQNGANFSNLALSLGKTNANGWINAKDFAAPQLQFALNIDKIDVAELRETFGASATPGKRAAGERGPWQLTPLVEAQTAVPRPQQPGPLNNVTGGGTVNIGAIQDNDLVVTNAHGNVVLNRGLVTINGLTADLYNGKESGTVAIDLRQAPPVYNVNLQGEKVDANKLISAISNAKQVLYGSLNSRVNASFRAPSADAIARSLNGAMSINLTNGKLMNVDVLHELAAVGKFLGNAVPATPKGFTDVAQLSGTFDVKNGVAHTNDLKALIDAGTLAATGLINLGEQSLNLRATAVLNRALSQQVGGNQIGGFMNTALANKDGELVVPVIVTGTFQHPQVAPDVQQMAQMKVQNLLPSTKNSGQLGGVMNKVLGGAAGQTGNANKQQQGAAAPSQKPPANQNQFSDILNQVTGKKKGQQPQSSPPPSQSPPP